MVALAVSSGLVALIAWGALNAVPPIEKVLPHQDKLEHCAAFGALMLWMTIAFGLARKSLAAACVCVLAMTLELGQATFSTSRSGSVDDLIASVVGVGLALGFITIVQRLVSARRFTRHRD